MAGASPRAVLPASRTDRDQPSIRAVTNPECVTQRFGRKLTVYPQTGLLRGTNFLFKCCHAKEIFCIGDRG
jgi:hypothetical protein